MLTFPLKKKYFQQIKEGTKTHEYRPVGNYWRARTIGSKVGDQIKFQLGYTSENILAELISITIIPINEIPDTVEISSLYPNKIINYFYDIRFKLLNKKTFSYDYLFIGASCFFAGCMAGIIFAMEVIR